MGPNDPEGKAQKIRIDGLNFLVREVLAGDRISELQLPKATYVTDASGKEVAVIERHGSTIEDYKIDSEYVFVLRGSGNKYGALEAGTFAVEAGGKLRALQDAGFPSIVELGLDGFRTRVATLPTRSNAATSTTPAGPG
jgi:hypothetical protein